MFEPKYQYTNALVNALIQLEHHKTKLENIETSYETKQKILTDTKKRNMFHMAQMLGMPEITLNEAEKLANARIHSQPTEPHQHILINFRSVLDFNRSSIADTYPEVDESVMTHINKLIITNWRESWDSRFRNFQEQVDERHDSWSYLHDREKSDEERINEFKETIEWYKNNAPKIPFVVRFGILVYKFIEFAPFIAGNQHTTISIADYVFLKNGYSSKLYSATAEFFHNYNDALVNAFTMSKSNYDMTYWLEGFVDAFRKHIIKNREHINKFLIAEEKSKQQPFLDLNKRQIKILKYLQTVPTIKREDYCHMMDVSTMTAFRDLNDLSRKKLIKVEGKGRGTKYRLASM